MLQLDSIFDASPDSKMAVQVPGNETRGNAAFNRHRTISIPMILNRYFCQDLIEIVGRRLLRNNRPLNGGIKLIRVNWEDESEREPTLASFPTSFPVLSMRGR